MMHGSERYGYLVMNGRPTPDDVITRYCGVTQSEYTTLLDELFSHVVPRKTSEGIIYSHRMVNDHKMRKEWRKRKINQRIRERDVPKTVTQRVTPVSRPSSSSSSSSSSILNTKTNTAQKPRDSLTPSEQETKRQIEARDRRLTVERVNGRGGMGSIRAGDLGLKVKKHILEKEKARREKAGASTESIGDDD